MKVWSIRILSVLALSSLSWLAAEKAVSAPPVIMPFPELEPETIHNPFSFLVYGDVQDSYDDGHRKLVDLMEKEPASFILNVGDMAPDKGKDYDRYFYPEVQNLASQLPFFPAIGNHDIDWKSESGRYPFRSFFQRSYDWLAEQPDNSHLSPDNQRLWYSFRYATSLFLALDSNLFITSGYYEELQSSPTYRHYREEQLRWVRDVLEKASGDPTIKTKYIFFHHSPFISKENKAFLGLFGGHENDRKMMVNQQMPDDESRVRYLLDLFRLHKVTAVFSGHEHYYERWREIIQEDGNPVHTLNWVVVGSGGVKPRSHRKFGDERLSRYFREDKIYHHYLERISEVNPAWTSSLDRVYPDERYPSGKIQNYMLVSVDGTSVEFRTVDVSGQIRDSGFFSQ